MFHGGTTVPTPWWETLYDTLNGMGGVEMFCYGVLFMSFWTLLAKIVVGLEKR